MPNVPHSTLTDPDLHEPKGLAAADEGATFWANGVGSGQWITLPFFHGAHPQQFTTSADAAWGTLTPGVAATWGGDGKFISGTTYTDERLKYTGTAPAHAFLSYRFRAKHNLGTTTPYSMWFTILKNDSVWADAPIQTPVQIANADIYVDLCFPCMMAVGDTFRVGAYFPAGGTITFTGIRATVFGQPRSAV